MDVTIQGMPIVVWALLVGCIIGSWVGTGLMLAQHKIITLNAFRFWMAFAIVMFFALGYDLVTELQ